MEFQSSIQLARNRVQGHLSKYLLSWFTRDDEPSDTPITLMVPVAPKDVARARRSVPEMIRHLTHPIDRVVIAAPDHPETRPLCRELGADFVDETEPLKALIGADALQGLAGWYRQQILKLISPIFCEAEHVVSIDSDTYPVRPISFVMPDGRAIIQQMPRDTSKYHQFTELMIGHAPYARKSFVAHCMLFQRLAVEHLFNAIEAHHGGAWHETLITALANKTPSLGEFSEFDMLGHYLARDRRETILIRNCANLKVSSAQFFGTEPLPASHRRFRFVSNHEHAT